MSPDEELREAKNATVMAAATAEQALRRLIAAEAVVEAAEKLVDNPNSINAHWALEEAVVAWRGSRSS